MRDRKSVAMPLVKRCASPEASTSMPKAGVLTPAEPLRNGISASDVTDAGSSS